MVFCCALYLVSKLIFWQATGFGWFLLERILLGVVYAGLSGVDTSIIYLSCAKGESQRAFGIYNSLQTLGLLIAAAVFSAFIGDDYRLAGALTVISYGAAAALSLLLTEVREGEKMPFNPAGFMTALSLTLRDRRLLLFLAGVALFNEAHQTITVFLNQLQYVRCGLSSSAIGYIYIAVTVAGLIGAASQRMTRTLGGKRTGVLLYVAAVAACALLAFTDGAWLSVSGILVLRVSNSLFQPLQLQLQNDHITTKDRATALSINAMLTDSVGVGTNLVFGALAKVSLASSFLFGAVICAAGLVLFLEYKRID